MGANIAVVNGVTCTICSHCAQAHIAETDIIIRLQVDKLNAAGTAPVKRDLLAVAMTMQAMYANWDLISQKLPIEV